MEKYRIDYDYEKVYIYDPEENVYLAYASFFGLGVDKNTSEAEIVRTIEEDILGNTDY